MGKTKYNSKKKAHKKKIHLVFDENKRKEFLTGFHKRKLQRKKQAQEKLESQLKEERKRLKQEAKESYKKLVVSHKPIPELENLLAEEYEDDDATVKVVELSTFNIANQNNWIGSNQPRQRNGGEEESESERDSDKDSDDQVPGMELKPRKKQKTAEVKRQTFGSEKEVKKALKKEATKKVKKSKVFQMKNKIERQKQKKKSFQQKKQRIKIRNQIQSKKNKHNSR